MPKVCVATVAARAVIALRAAREGAVRMVAVRADVGRADVALRAVVRVVVVALRAETGRLVAVRAVIAVDCDCGRAVVVEPRVEQGIRLKASQVFSFLRPIVANL